VPRADVRGHDENRVLEVNRVAESVGQLTILKNLQQDVEDIRVRLLDLIKQNHRVGRTLDALGELAALLVAHVPRRRTDQLRDAVLFHVLRHIEADQRLVGAEEELRQAARHLRFAHAGRAQEQERTDGTAGILEPGTRAANGAGESRDGLLLRNHPLVQLLLNAEQLLRLLFLDARHRHAGPARNHILNVLAAHNARGRVVEVILFAQRAQCLALLAFLVGIEARLFELMVGNRRIHPVDDELDPLLHLGDLIGQRGLAELDARAGLIDDVDGLVGQKTIRDVAVRVRNGELDRVVGVADRMKLLIAILDAHDDLDGVGLIRRRHLDGLEAAFERAILFDRLAELARRGCANALHLAARQGRLEDVGRIERTFGRTGAHQRMQLIDEDDGVLVFHQLLHDRLEPLLELAAIFGSGHDQRKVETENALVGQKARHLAIGDALGQAFDDGGLADTGFADQHRIVLGAAAKNLNHAFELAVAADERVQLAIHGGLCQIA